jgi:hypothetical protein
MTAPNLPTAEVIAEHHHSGRHTVRIFCPFCARTHQHWAANVTGPLTAPCGQGSYTIGTK